MLLDHWSDIYVFEMNEAEWKKRYPNFTPQEFACSYVDGEGQRQDCQFCGGEMWVNLDSFDMIQRARKNYGMAIHFNSSHRCGKRNHMVGGAKNSEHLRIAYDCRLKSRRYRRPLLKALFVAGFTTFGLYNTFIHTDPRPWRLWIMSQKRIWQSIYDEIVKRED